MVCVEKESVIVLGTVVVCNNEAPRSLMSPS